MGQAIEHVEDEGFAAAWRQRLDSDDVGGNYLGRRQERVRLQVRWHNGMFGLGNRPEVVVTAQPFAPVQVDHDVARSLVQQGARFRDGQVGVLDGENARIAFLHDIRCRISIFDRAGAEVQQFSVIA